MSSPDNSKVYVTGMSCVTALAPDIEGTFQGLLNGSSGIETIKTFDPSGWSHQLGAELKDYNPRTMITNRKLLKMISRHDVIGLNAVRQLVESSKIAEYRDSLDDPKDFNDRTGIFVASPGLRFDQQNDILPLMSAADRSLKKFGEKVFDIVHPMWFLRILSNNVLAYTGIEYQFKGANENYVNLSVSGSQAIGEAQRAITHGLIDRALVIGYDSSLEPQNQAYFIATNQLSATGLRPFCKGADGTILAEGAGAILLESDSSAKARGATRLAEIIGQSSTCESADMFVSGRKGLGLMDATIDCLEQADIEAADIGMITANGFGQQSADESEALALSEIFSQFNTPTTAMKWALGNTFAASGVIETALTIKSLKQNTVPGINGLEDQIPELGTLKVSNTSQPPKSNIGMIVSRGMGLQNACTLVNISSECL